MSGLLFERLKTERSEWPQLLRRDIFPENVREQCWQLWVEGIGAYIEEAANTIITQIRHAIGVSRLNSSGLRGHSYDQRYFPSSELRSFLLAGMTDIKNQQNVEYMLSALELMCRSLNKHDRGTPNVIGAINYRLRLGGVGYKFADNTLIPVDDENLTDAAVIPTVSLLNRPAFIPAYKYLMQTFSDYKSGTPKSLETAIDNVQKSVETLLKIIFDERDITYNKNDTYMPLIQKAKESGLFPHVSDDKLNPLMNNLKTLGEIRNRGGGHGSPEENKATDKLVRLAIHHATANMLYIAETHLETKEQVKKRKQG